MFQAAKGFKKEDLIYVAEEIGETLPQKVTIADLKDIILKSKPYTDDPQFVTNILLATISDRRKQEEENLRKFEYEEKLKQREFEEREKIRQHELELLRIQGSRTTVGESRINVSTGSKNKFDLPKLEFRQFSGDIKEWLAFWSQFQHIHDDNDIAPENKFQYLIQATVSGSRAREVVDSFPPTGANYAKVIESLKARFGREDLLVEVYVRELLKLVISVHKNEKLSMTSLYDKVESHMRALDSLGVTTDKCASILYPMVESCFNEDFLKAWNRHPSSSSSADAKERLNNLMQFIKTEVEGEERIHLAMSGFGLNEPRSIQPLKKKQWNKVPTAANLLTTSIKDNKKSCIFCMGKHASADCFSAQKMSLEERKSVVREKQCCFACLTPGHTARKCRVFLKCILCGRKHVPLMCEVNESRKNDVKKTEESEVNNEVNMSNVSGSPKVFLQTLKCKLISDKKEILVRVILDTGSSKSYIVKSLAEEMGYNPVKKETLVHSLFGGVKSGESKHSCYRIRLKSFKNNFACNFEALDQVTICSDVSPVCPGPWLKELQEMDITLSDVGAVSHPVDVLIGADIFGKIMTGQRKILSSGLVAIETLLGWTLLGKVPDNEVTSTNAMMVTSLLVKDMDISDMWRLDSIGIQDPSEQKTKEELHEATMDHFLKTVEVNEDHRFHVCLPWIDTHLPLPSNFNLALRGLEVTSRKLKNEKLYDAYGEVFNEWEQENIIEEVPKEETMLPCHYLPHRHVVKENSTTKIRPVFNASSKQKGSPSLNDCVEKGLNLIELIPSIISRFRMFKFGVTADIRKAFLQISLNKQDRNFLRFLWYNEDGELKYYRHCRVVFGVSCSPFLLAATIKYHLETKLDEAIHGNKRYPENIIRQLLNSFYVDNCLISVKSETELKRFIEVAREIMAERKFDLRGWEFSSPSESIESPTNILGMMWDRQNDTLSISLPNVTEAKNEVITKRNILAASHKVFDPIGITGPVMLRPKLWLQDLWKSKIGWDEEVDSKIRQDFLKWLNELEHLKNLKVPRWLHCEVGPENISLHFFCDASKLAYSAVAFLRVDDGATVHVQLIQSKTRIAPCGKKETTIARLELLGATISARLSTEVLKEFKTENVYFWTDSTTVLAWLKREDVWGAFVQNRVQEIRQLTPVEAWRHVPGSSNPADLPSRGCSSQHLCYLKWWDGPSWLYLSPHEWPAIDTERDVNEEEVIKEKRKTVVSSMINVDVEEICSDRFSSYSKNIRVVAWSLRFIHNISHENKLKGNLSFEEFQKAESLFFKSIQSKTFQDDKFLSKMQAFRDENGLLRIKTKLIESEENLEFKLPVLLPACTIVEKLIREEHEKAMHAGFSIVLAKLRERFWVLRGKKLVKKVLSKCVACQRYKSRPVEVPFAPLPRERITQTKVFEVSGVDYAGPLNLKIKGKAWIVLFTCAVYRAVHFELVESLSTDAYIQALRRFIARRGRVSVLYSDNGTSFVGANNALKGLNWEEIAVFSTARKITWKFIPPTAAWWGGWWERMVRMLKELLRRVLGKSTVNYEELNTILCDCEAVINARPLTYLQNDPNDLVPLTPDMFIYSGCNSETPDLDSVDRSSLIKRIKYLQKLRENLRQRFRNEYLALLVHKGIRRSDVLNVGDVVLIGQDNRRRIDWPLGIILEVFPGRDGVPRVARLKTSRGERIRPFQRLYPLEISGTDVDVLQAAKSSLERNLVIKSSVGKRPEDSSSNL